MKDREKLEEAEFRRRLSEDRAQQAEAQVAALLNSTSWQITAPLRWCAQKLTRQGRPRNEVALQPLLAETPQHAELPQHVEMTLPAVNPPKPAAMLPVLPLEDFVRCNVVVQLAELTAVDGNVTLQELAAIACIIAYHQSHNIFEIGTFDGRTTLNMAINAPADASVYTLDLPASALDNTRYALDFYDRKYVDKPSSGARFLGRLGSEKIRQLYGDSANFDFSEFLGKMDLVFVDGSHTRLYVQADTRTAMLLRSSHGIILWHDYNSGYWDDVTETLNLLRETDPRFKNIFQIADTSIAVMLPDDTGSIPR